jgi:hypothetical protein
MGYNANLFGTQFMPESDSLGPGVLRYNPTAPLGCRTKSASWSQPGEADPFSQTHPVIVEEERARLEAETIASKQGGL